MSSASKTIRILGPEDVAPLFGKVYSSQELASFPPPPPTREGYFTFFDPGLSIAQMHDYFCYERKKYFASMMSNLPLREKAPIVLNKEQPRYVQIRCGHVPKTQSGSFAQRRKRLRHDEVIPSARVVVTAAIIYCLTLSKALFDRPVMTSDVKSVRGEGRERVYVCLSIIPWSNYFPQHELRISVGEECEQILIKEAKDYLDSSIGLPAMIKT